MFCLKHFDNFESKINAVACVQMTFQRLTLPIYVYTYRKVSNIRRTKCQTEMFLVSACSCLYTIY